MNTLFKIAEEKNIKIDFFRMKKLKAFSMSHVIVINPDKIRTTREKKECTAHELGHHMRNAFYNIESTLETRARQEERATRWAVEQLIPADKLKTAMKAGYTEIWQLADYFDVSVEFMIDAVRVHKLKNNI